jgi:hypothetical protein
MNSNEQIRDNSKPTDKETNNELDEKIIQTIKDIQSVPESVVIDFLKARGSMRKQIINEE